MLTRNLTRTSTSALVVGGDVWAVSRYRVLLPGVTVKEYVAPPLVDPVVSRLNDLNGLGDSSSEAPFLRHWGRRELARHRDARPKITTPGDAPIES
jgi:hypothetical protein